MEHSSPLTPLGATLQDICAKWQKRLRLQDWRCEVITVPRDHLSTNSTNAENHIFREKRQAHIYINRRPLEGWDPIEESDEYRILHELIHLFFDPFKAYREDNQDLIVAEEQAVHALTTALLEVDQGRT